MKSELIEKQVRKFKEETGRELEFKDCKLYYDGYLDLSGTGITSLPDNLTVGGYLDLSGTGITSLPDNLAVGGDLDLRGTKITDTSNVNKKRCDILVWHNRKYIKADGIFSKVISYKGNIYKINQIGGKKDTLLQTVTGNGRMGTH